MKILVLCNRVPFPPHDGGAIVTYDYLHHLAREKQEVVILAINTPKHFQPDTVLKDKGRLLTVFVNTNLSPVKAFLNLFKKLPYNIERFFAPAYAKRLKLLLQSEQFDIIQMEGSHLATYVPLIRSICATPIVLRAHNVEYTIWERLARHEKNVVKKYYLRLLSRKIYRFEQEYLNKFDAIAAITEQDKARIQALGCTVPIVVIPAGVEIDRFTDNPEIIPKPLTLFMIGSLNWMPNVEGIEWFLENIWPAVSENFPDVELHIAGSSPPDYLLKLSLPKVKVHGFVESASSFMQQYSLMLAPLLSGGGMRVKIIEGMALGKCILTTPVGAEGIYCEHQHTVLIGQTSREWIDIIRNYVTGKIDVRSIGENARNQVLAHYDNQVMIRQYLELYRKLIFRAKNI